MTEKEEVELKKKLKDEERSDLNSRFSITLSIVLLCSVIGIPLWYNTTSLYRAELPINEINYYDNNLLNVINYEIPIYLDLPAPLEGMLIDAQKIIDESLSQLSNKQGVPWKIVLKEGKGSTEDYTIELQHIEAEDRSGAGESFFISPFGKSTKLNLSNNVIGQNKVPEMISRVIIEEIFPYEIEFFYGSDTKQDDMAVSFSPDYHVRVSLLQGGPNPVSWDIESCSHIFTKYLEKLAPIAKFTFDSVLEHYETLPDSVASHLEWNNDTQSHVLLAKDTSTFIDYSAWGLDQNTDSAPTINFIAYIPSPEIYPLKIQNSESTSFIVPQWGGVQIVNIDSSDLSNPAHLTQEDLIPLLETFASQLFYLLGGIEKPKSLEIRIDSLTRMKSYKNLKGAVDNLVSLVKLTNQLETISIPDSTLSQVQESLESIKESIALINQGKWKEANLKVNNAALISDKAFFEKDMVQQMYFPDEHKMAVYTPLLAPIGIILFLGLMRYNKEKKVVNEVKEKSKRKVYALFLISAIFFGYSAYCNYVEGI